MVVIYNTNYNLSNQKSRPTSKILIQKIWVKKNRQTAKRNKRRIKKYVFWLKKFLGVFVEKKIWSKKFFLVKNFIWLCVHARTHMHTCVRTQASFQDEL